MATRANQPAPLDVLLAALPGLPRPVLARLTARLIDHLDSLDGDVDAEQTGDEAEPDFITKTEGHGPGCSVGDPDYGIEDEPEGPTEDWRDARPIADPEAYREHRRRIRRTRCVSHTHYGSGEYRLWQEPTVPSKRQLLRRKRGRPRRVRP